MNFQYTASSLLVFALIFSGQISGQVFHFPALHQLKLEHVFEQTISKSMGQFGSESLGSLLLGDFPNLSANPVRIARCYISKLDRYEFDIFNPLTTFRSIVTIYYKIFPEKIISALSVSNLFNSTREIISLCLDPGRPSDDTSKYGFTSLSDVSIETYRNMSSTSASKQSFYNETIEIEEIVEVIKLRKKRQLIGTVERQCRPSTNQLPTTFDWRHYGAVTPAREQNTCGACWAFSTISTLEGVLLAKKKTRLSAHQLDLSEQELINCAISKGCGGGNFYNAMSYIRANGIASEKTLPYQNRKGQCPRRLEKQFYIKDFCLLDDPDEHQMRAVVHTFGPAFVMINTMDTTRNYRGGVFSNRRCPSQRRRLNHGITLIGWTRDAWILKNSFGPKWGESGILRLRRGRNQCGIQNVINWPLV